MKLPDVFSPSVSAELIQRVERLTPETQPKWGKMDVAQMLAHSNVSYDIAYGRIETNHNFLMKLMLKYLIKPKVVGTKPYKPNSPTAPIFKIADEKDFAAEKQKLIENIQVSQEHGHAHFEGKENPGFGELTAEEWSNLFYKHLDHHLSQFGV